MKATTLALTTLMATALAVPNVTPIPLSQGASPSCADWPTPGTQGAYKILVSDSEDAAFNEFPLQPASTVWGTRTVELAGVDLLKSFRYAKAPFFCQGGEAIVGAARQSLRVSKDMRNAWPVVDAAEGSTYGLEVYAHEVDGVRQEGVFLGALNRTTWGFNYVRQACGEDGTPQKDFFQVKLLGLPVDEEYPPTAGYDPEFQGFLKLTGW